jgi:predicted PurR-regulated permease PerM
MFSYLVVGFIIAYEINFIFEWIEKHRSSIKIFITITICVLLILQIVYNWEKVDETKNKIPQQFLAKTFSDLEPNAIVLVS